MSLTPVPAPPSDGFSLYQGEKVSTTKRYPKRLLQAVDIIVKLDKHKHRNSTAFIETAVLRYIDQLYKEEQKQNPNHTKLWEALDKNLS